MREITIEELLDLKDPVVIDVRAPIEYKDGFIPGSINVPLFTDEERHEIGIIYKNDGQAAAKWRAMELVSPKLPELLMEIKEVSEGKTPVIHCWRGGNRSKAVTSFLDFSGLHARRLSGGYRAFRQAILKLIPSLLPEKAVVLHGLTGVGKTEILKILAKKGYPIMDLEGMAAHRGSIFGTVGLGQANNQKTFDALLFQRLTELQGSPYFIMEAESKRVGKCVQPDELMEKKRTGVHIYLSTTMEQRIKHITEEYIEPFKSEKGYHEQIEEALEKVFRRLKNEEARSSLTKALEERKYEDMIEVLLKDYYDPKYDHKLQEYEGDFYDIYSLSHEEAAERIAEILEEKFSLLPNPSGIGELSN